MTESELNKIAIEYSRLNELKKALEKRLEEMSKKLKGRLGEGTHKFGDYELTLQIKDRTTLDEQAALALLAEKPDEVFIFCTEQRVNPDYVEQAYLDGMLTDADLRAIRKPQYSVALIAKKVVPDVQSDG